MSVALGLLGLLSREPAHGYQLRQDFEATTGATWPLNIGQVYTTLQRLERDGLVEAEPVGADGSGEHEDRRQYRLTPAGAARLAQWFDSPVPREAPARDELVIKLAMAMSLPTVDAVAVIDLQRAGTLRALQALTRARAAAEDDMIAALVADAAIFRAEAEIRWLDHCEAGLTKPRERGMK